MRKISILLVLMAMVPLGARAFNPYDNSSASYQSGDVLAYVAMPLAVSAVCDVRGVQTDRVGELVGYMNQAEVAPADFVDVFRYVPVGLMMRTDGRPDFVGWVHGEVDRGVIGATLVSAMETQLRTYDNYVPVSNYRTHRRYRWEDYSYAYEPDYYVPDVIRRHCDRLLLDPYSLVEMPLAVDAVIGLGLPYDRVGSLAVELNLGGIPPLQFVEFMRYAPAALVVGGGGYYNQPDFVQFVRTERIDGVTGYPLVQAVDQRLQAYNVAPQIDLVDPAWGGQQAYYAAPQNYVAPIDPTFVPQVVQTRVASNFAAGGATFNQPAPAVAAAPQVQRLLASPNSGAVVANPAEARRELARANRAQREAPVASAPIGAAPAFAPGRIENRGRGQGMARQPVNAAPQFANQPNGNGRGRGRREAVAPQAIPPMMSSAPAREHGRGRGGPPAMAAPAAAPAPMIREHGRGHGGPPAMAAPAAAPAPVIREHGRGHGGPPAMAAPAAAPAPMAAPAVRQHGRGRAMAAPVAVAPAPAAAAPAPAPAPRGHGHGGGPPAAVAAPAPAPAGAPAPAAAPPGQQKKKEKDKGKD